MNEKAQRTSSGVRWARWAIVGVPIAALSGLIIVAWVARSPDEATSSSEPDAKPVVFVAGPRALTSVLTLNGTAQLRDRYDVLTPAPPEGERAVLTSSAAIAGSVVQPCTEILSISDRPIIAMPGQIAPYRDIRPGMSGTDVGQLQIGLQGCGFRVSDTGGVYGPSTANAIEQMYRAIGREPLTTLGSLAALRARRAALATEEANAAAAVAAGDDNARAVLSEARTAIAASAAEDGVVVPLSELVVIPTLPATFADTGPALGQELEADEVLLSLEAGPQIVEAEVSESQAQQLEDGLEAFVEGEPRVALRLVEVTDASAPNPDSDPSVSEGSMLIARFELVDPSQILTNDTPLVIRVDLVPPREAPLVVPSSAVVVDADGSARVLVRDGAKQRSINVQVKSEVDGWIEVAPGGDLESGDEVILGAAAE